MAEDQLTKAKNPKRRIKPAQTVRERTAEAAQQSPKPKRVGKAIGGIGVLLRAIGRFVGKLLSPFSFLLWPFKTRPARFIGRILAVVLLINFFRGAFRELRDVEWPDRKQTTQLTFAVFVFAIIFGIIIAITDYGLDRIFKRILVK